MDSSILSSDAPRVTRVGFRIDSQQALMVSHDTVNGLKSPMSFNDQTISTRQKEKVKKERAELKRIDSNRTPREKGESSLNGGLNIIDGRRRRIKADLALVEIVEPTMPIESAITNTACLKDGIRGNGEYDELIKWNDIATKTFLDLKFEKKRRRDARHERVLVDKASSSLDETDPNVIRLQNTLKYNNDPRDMRGRKSKHRINSIVKVYPNGIEGVQSIEGSEVIKKKRKHKEAKIEKKSRIKRAKNEYGIPGGFDSESNLQYALGAKAPIDWNGYNDIPALPSESTRCTDERSKRKSKEGIQVIKSCSSDSSYMIVKMRKKERALKTPRKKIEIN